MRPCGCDALPQANHTRLFEWTVALSGMTRLFLGREETPCVVTSEEKEIINTTEL